MLPGDGRGFGVARRLDRFNFEARIVHSRAELSLKAVFDTKPNSGYDDEIVERYHFPTRSDYMAAAQAAVDFS